jgi:hypothetical protein
VIIFEESRKRECREGDYGRRGRLPPKVFQRGRGNKKFGGKPVPPIVSPTFIPWQI